MNIPNNRRRNARNRTIVIDTSSLFDREELNQASNTTEINTKDSMAFKSIDVSGCSKRERSSSLFEVEAKDRDASLSHENRTFAFKELMSAFRLIEKRSNDSLVDSILKKFKTNEELEIKDSQMDTVKMDIECQIFPKIINNPFISGSRSREGTPRKQAPPSPGRTRRVSFDTKK